MIVEHITVSSTFASAFSTFNADVADSELHELPGTCAHFVIDTDGTIYQLVPLGVMCRHTVGLNWTAIGIEHVGMTDAQVLGNARQMASSLALTAWLMSRFHIELGDVIGHNESLTSRFHKELYAGWRCQTHGDFVRADMNVYRSRLATLAKRLGVPTRRRRPQRDAALLIDRGGAPTARVCHTDAVTWLWIVIGIVVVLLLFGIYLFNRIVRLRNEVNTGWSNIDVQLKRRNDLIPNLVEAVKGYAAHERGVFEQVTEARAAMANASSPAAAGAADSLLGQAIGRLFAVAEAYPDLKASENFRQLQSELTDTEDKISAARRYYNATVQAYNTAIQTFPSLLFAGTVRVPGARVLRRRSGRSRSRRRELPVVAARR